MRKKTLSALLCFSLFVGGPLGAEGPASSASQKEAQQEIRDEQMRQIKSFYLSHAGQAKVPTAPLVVEFYNEAVEYFQKGEMELAEQALQEAIGLDPRSYFALELMGDIRDQQHDVEAARQFYQKAYLIQRSEPLREKIERLSREKGIEKEFRTVATEKFVLKYQEEGSAGDEKDFLADLEEVYDRIARELGAKPAGPIVVLLYGEEEFREIVQLPHWIAAVYDGKVRLPAYRNDRSREELRAMTVHEMTHAFVAALSGGKAPPWINEGLAQYFENQYRKIDTMVLDAAVRVRSLLSLDEVISARDLSQKKDWLYAGLFYQQTFHLTVFLVDRYGMFKITQLLKTYAKDPGPEEAITEAFGTDIPGLEEQWKHILIVS
ncbi:MAG: peptidase MA family metallohydrolase [Candidatus Omnitrophota bacterium]